MNYKKRVRELIEQGCSKRKIATELGVSEYMVRGILRSLVIDKIRSERTDTFDDSIRLVKTKTSKDKKKKAAILSDIHIPYHDRAALSVCLDYLIDLKPETIILNGDILDFYAVSRFQKDPMRIATLQSEIDETRSFLNLVRRQHKNAKIFYVRGNHEERLEKFLIDRADSLVSLRCLCIDELLGLSDNNITFVDTSVYVGDLEVTHGQVARTAPGGSAKSHFDRTASSVLIGHIHRLNTTRFRNKWGVQTLIENGCLCGLQPDYARLLTNWQQGFSVIEYSAKSGSFLVTQHLISDGTLVVGDKVYTAEYAKR